MSGLPGAKWSDADLLVNWIRAVKSPAEIAYLRKAARLAEGAMRAAYDAIAPGVRECDAVARIYAAQVAGQAEYAGDITALPPTILAGENASAPHILWGDRRFTGDETIAIELAGACRHYTAGLARTLQLGKPEQRVVEVCRRRSRRDGGCARRYTAGRDGERGGSVVAARSSLATA